MQEQDIAAAFSYTSHYVDINGSKMHYIEQGQGDPILFLHGMPTWSYVWRNVIPHLSSLGRCIAIDFIGMGRSDKPNIPYSLSDHIQYVEKFIETLQLKKVTLCVHGWGGLIGLDIATRHEKNCKGLVLYETYLRPFTEDDVALAFQEQLHILEKIAGIYHADRNGVNFVESVLQQDTLRKLTSKEIQYYCEPFFKPGTGRPLYQYLDELLLYRDQLNLFIDTYSKKLMQILMPKLLLYSMPGLLTSIASVMWAKENFPNTEVMDMGEEIHYAQESYPKRMGETISVWLQGVDSLCKK